MTFRRRPRVHSSRFRPRLTGTERLESRRLLALTPWMITADANPASFDDVILIRGTAADATRLEVVMNGVVVGEQAIADPRPIEIHAGLGDDIVRVDLPGLTTPLRIFAGPGHDTVIAGDGDDLIDGGTGDDTLIGRGGNDRLRGRLGDDVLLGDDGDDLLRGGGGADTIAAGPGQDRLGGGADLDRMFAALGRDRLNQDATDVVVESKQANPVFKARGPVEYQRFLRASRAMTATGSNPVWAGGRPGTSLAFETFPATAADASGTNNQVAGVEEADLVKTDGVFVYALVDGELFVIDADPASLEVRSRSPVPGGAAGLFIHGHRVTVVSTEWVPLPEGQQQIGRPFANELGVSLIGIMPPGNSQTVVTVFDLADPAAPRVVEQTRLEGTLLAARSIGGNVYVVVEDYADVAATDTFLDAAGAGILIPAGGGTGDLLTVARLSPSDDVAGIDQAVVMAGVGGTVYASEQTVYVAAPTWGGGVTTTTITAFSLTDTIEQVASGSIAGYVPNQFAMDEHADGTLRVVAQEGLWGTSRSTALAVLERQGADLVVRGRVSGIAPGEDLKSVRFLDDQAFLVTFLQIDPLFVVDLTDSTAPRVVGELKVTGFSSYLHPMGADRLFGVGQGDRPNTGQLSLFDVSMPGAPALLDAVTLGGPGGWTSSAAAWDHRAFSWFADEGLLAVPVTTWNHRWDASGSRDDYLVSVFAVDPATGFSHAFDVRHDSPVLRSLRIADRLYTVSSAAVAVHELGGSHAELGRVRIGNGAIDRPIIVMVDSLPLTQNASPA